MLRWGESPMEEVEISVTRMCVVSTWWPCTGVVRTLARKIKVKPPAWGRGKSGSSLLVCQRAFRPQLGSLNSLTTLLPASGWGRTPLSQLREAPAFPSVILWVRSASIDGSGQTLGNVLESLLHASFYFTAWESPARAWPRGTIWPFSGQCPVGWTGPGYVMFPGRHFNAGFVCSCSRTRTLNKRGASGACHSSTLPDNPLPR